MYRRPVIESKEVVRKIVEALLEKKGENVVILDVEGVSNFTDYYVLVTGNSSPHIKALLNEIEAVLKSSGQRCYRRSGEMDSGWMIADFLDVVVHVFTPEMREYYTLEQLWSDAKQLAPSDFVTSDALAGNQ